MKLLFTIMLATIMMSSVVYSQYIEDPGDLGPFSTLNEEYDLEDFILPSVPTIASEIIGSVDYPSNLSSGSPVLLFMHGRHYTCYNINNTNEYHLNWPCSVNEDTIPSYRGYSYLAKLMASHGYVVISISANSSTGNGLPNKAVNELIQHHLERWEEFNTSAAGPFGNTFVGKLDLDNIGLMGHSRGGEGVVSYALYNAAQANPFGVKAIITLAPTNNLRPMISNIPTLNITPYCAGDVPELEGVKYYDDVRYLDTPDTAAKYQLLMLGANHNYFNTIWTPELYAIATMDDVDLRFGSDKHCDAESNESGRYTAAQQRAAFKAYASAFFRTYIGEETAFLPLLRVEKINPPASAMVTSDEIFMSYHPPANKRVDINRMDLENSYSINTLGGSVTKNGLVDFSVCRDDAPCLGPIFKYPHSAYSSNPEGPRLTQLVVNWDSSDDYFDNAIPPQFKDFTNFEYIQFRVAVNVGSPLNSPGSNLDFNIELIDANGNSSSLRVGQYSEALYSPPGDSNVFLPRSLHNTVMLPLAELTNLDLANITNVRFRFNETLTGSIFITDLALSSSADLDFTYCYSDIELKAGLNWISFNHTHYDNSVTEVFSDLISSGNLEFISGFDEVKIIFNPFGPPFLNTLTELKDGFGYTVKVKNDVVLNSSGNCIDEDLALQLLKPGSNFIAYLPAIQQSPAEYFADFIAEGSLEYVRGFDNGIKIFDPDQPEFLNTLKIMKNGFGYRVKINAPNAKIANNSSVSDMSEIDIKVVPNPVKSKAIILLQSNFFGNATILVYNINGREISNVIKNSVDLKENETNSFEFNAENLPSGKYIIKVITEGESLYETIIVL